MGDESRVTPVEVIEADKVTAPVEEPNNAIEAEEALGEETDKATVEEIETPPVNSQPLSWEKREELRRNLDASKREALRLKQEKEQLEAQLRVREEQSIPQLTQDDLAVFKELARQAGVPLGDELESQRVAQYEQERDSQLQKFFDKHPEYNKPGDPNSDAAWASLEAELSQFTAPEDPKKWLSLLTKAHKILALDDTALAVERGKALGMAQANISAQRTSGGGSGGNAPQRVTSKASSPEKDSVHAMFRKARPQYYQGKA